MKRIFKIFDYIFVLRPTLFFPVWAVFLSGFFAQQQFGVAAPEAAQANHAFIQNGHNFIWVGGFLTLLMGAVFILNQIMDRHSDNQNKKLFLISHGHLTPKAAFIEATILIVIAILFSFVFSLKMGLIFVLILLITGYLYSFSPFSWKDKPIWGLVGNILGAFLIFLAGWSIQGNILFKSFYYAIPYICAVASVYLLTTLPDVEGDKDSNKRTFGVRFGASSTVYTSLTLLIIALGVSFITKDELIFYPALFSLPFFLWASVKLQMSDIVRAIKYPILLLTFTVCIKWMVVYSEYYFVLVVAGIYYLSKIYYKLRFGIHYPNLKA